MISEKEFGFLSDIKDFGDLTANEFIYFLCTSSDLGASYLKRFLDDNFFVDGLDKLLESSKTSKVGDATKEAMYIDIKKFFALFPLSADTPYSSVSLLYYLMTSNNYAIRNAFTYLFQKFFVEQGYKKQDVSDLYIKLKKQLEDDTSLGNLVKEAKTKTNSQNRDNNIEFALSQGENMGTTTTDSQQEFLRKLKEARKKLKTAPEIAAILKQKVLSQDAVCDKMGEILFSVVNNFSLLDKSKTPIARMLFCGPSGSGKTLLSETIAKEFFNTEVLLIPCSQYQDSISANRLFGSAPGYVGYDDDTPLQTYLRNINKKGKKGVIILDEMEKMHKSVLNSLLSALDGNDFEMHSKNGGNETFNLSNCLIIGTTNLASNELGKEVTRLGFQTSASKRTENDDFDLIKKAADATGISPEFFNRFEHVFSFKKLTEEDYKQIAKKHCEDTLTSIKAKLPHLKIVIDDTAIKLITKLASSQGFNTRVIESMSTDALDMAISNYLLENAGSENGTIVISDHNGKLSATGEGGRTKCSAAAGG